jgi:ssDNA-binding Zn-finger/Zn-ribbon topoisomerase 1
MTNQRTGGDPCPDCGGPMLLRNNRKDGTPFWGCADYPNCTGTRASGGAAAYDGGGQRELLPSDRARQNDRQRWRQ